MEIDRLFDRRFNVVSDLFVDDFKRIVLVASDGYITTFRAFNPKRANLVADVEIVEYDLSKINSACFILFLGPLEWLYHR